MANLVDVVVPDVGEDDVEIIEILVQVGQSVNAEDAFVTVESDKASMDIPIPFAGTIKEISVKVGDKIKQGDVLGKAEEAGASASESADSDSQESKDSQDDTAESAPNEEAKAPKAASQGADAASSGGTQTIEVVVPDIGDVSDVEIIEILVSEGDTVAEEDGLLTLETDKATMDVPAPKAGKILSLKVKTGDKVSKGSLILTLEIGSSAGSQASASTQPAESDAATNEQAESDQASTEKSAPAAKQESQAAPASQPTKAPPVPFHPSAGEKVKTGTVYASPSVRRVAREFGVDLSQVDGTGRKNRIVKEDVQSFVKYELSRPKVAAGATTGKGEGGLQVIAQPKVDFSKFGEIEEKPLSRIQKLSGPNLHRNYVTIPHVTQFEEADITDLEDFRKEQNAIADKRKLGVKITPLVFMMKAVADALKHYPTFNTSLSLDGESLIYKKYYHIGIAVDTPNGLVVPVVRDVDKKGVMELSKELMEISVKARDGKLKVADMQGSCFTISSLGGIGGTAFTPIVNSPDVAILGVSKSEIKPKWDGKAFQPRLMLPLSLSYDHRVIDGAMAARFAVHLSECLADIRRILL